MATRKPIANYSGRLKEVVSTDTLPTSNLGSGTANSSTFLRGDSTWATPSGGAGTTWTDVTTTTGTLATANGYISDHASLLVTFTLPASAALGDYYIVEGRGPGGWKIAQNSGQTIRLEDMVSTSGATGYIASTTQYDSVLVRCTVANTEFKVAESVGNIAINGSSLKNRTSTGMSVVTNATGFTLSGGSTTEIAMTYAGGNSTITGGGTGTVSLPQTTVTVIGRIITTTSSPLTAGTVAGIDYVYFVTGTTTITLPTAVSNTNRYTINNDGSATVTVATTSSQTINGSLTITIAPNNTLEFISNNSNWKVI